MKIVIIEDERLTAEDLSETITAQVPGAEIVALLESVSSAVDWFRINEQPDLIFCDIQLGDGLSFEIFKDVSIRVPVIFCTAYDEYALQAFNANGMDYILKPFDKASIEAAFQKYARLKETFSDKNDFDQLFRLMESHKKTTHGSVLVYRQDKILPVRLENIALFYIENEITHLLTFENKVFTLRDTIDKLEQTASVQFFRVNRQFLVNRKAIREASQYFSRKLSLTLVLPFKETITVSKNKVSAFLNWLSEN